MGTSRESLFTGSSFLDGLFKLDKLQRDHRAGWEMYPKSRCLSKLPEAFKLAVKSLQSWHFRHGFENALPLLSPKCQELFRTFDLFFFPARSRKVCQWWEKWNKANSWGCQVSHMILLDKGGASSYLISHQQFSVNPDSNIKHEKANSSSSNGSSSQLLTVDEDRC